MLRLARRVPFLSPEEERELIRRAARGDGAATDRLIVSHLAVVVKIARGYGWLGIPVNDLIQEGTLGLIQAVRKFNPDRDARLSTYAMWWVRAAIQDYVVRSWSLVRLGRSTSHRSLFFSLKKHAGVEAPADDLLHRLAQRFGLPLPEVAGFARRLAGGDQPLDAPLTNPRTGESDALSFADRLVADQPDPEEAVARTGAAQLWVGLIERALAMLPAREAAIIRERHLNEAARTFEAIGRELGLSKDRVRQLEKKALARLHEMLKPLVAVHGLPG